MEIKFLRHTEINTHKWDLCISSAINANTSCFSWYLDVVNPNWSALILNDYQAVMPLPTAERYGFSFLLTPFFVEEIGVCSHIPPTSEILFAFAEMIPSIYNYIDIKADVPNPNHKKLACTQRSYLELDLIRPYKHLKASFSSEVIKHLEINKTQLHFMKDVMPNDIINGIKKSFPKYDNLKLDILRLLMSSLMRRRASEIIGAYDEHNNLIACICLSVTHAKSRLFFAWQKPETELLYPITGLIDYYLKTNSEKYETIQFVDYDKIIEPAIAEGFGANEFVFNLFRNKKRSIIGEIFKRYRM